MTTLLCLFSLVAQANAPQQAPRRFEGKVVTAGAAKVEVKLQDGTTLGFGPPDLAPDAKIDAGGAHQLADLKPGESVSILMDNGGFGPIREIRAAGASAPAAAHAPAGCPKEGHHVGKDAEGRDHCIRNGIMSCPKGFSQVLAADARFHCMTPPDAKCGKGQTAMKDREGRARCELPGYDKCPEEGYRVIRFPGDKYSCASPVL
ncbi:MAG TPA: hypothetical protein VLW85_24660 [Myxococcales bacterium]|nr:hypothetical protein [Myxococcales bacterium]